MKTVSNGKKTLLKFVINNGDGTRIRVLMWDNVAKVNSPKISHHQKMYITMGCITPTNASYHGNEDVVDVEFNAQAASTIKYLGILEGAGIIVPENYPEVAMETLLRNQDAPVSVTGFIKSPFVEVVYFSASYGGGSIVNGKHRLAVQIAIFKDKKEIEVGTCVKLMGKLKSRIMKTNKSHVEYYFEVPDMNHIVVIEGKTATEEEMSKAIISATSKRYSTGDLPEPKRRSNVQDAEEIQRKMSIEMNEIQRDISMEKWKHTYTHR
ncbi:uncharacterized protein LOC107043509 [Diachasma alloeum]|uniref:uncharacterized protein LOC107043509 n=1 Tax=Diachasma alloeum TaxID=454923 RepID=UPI0007381ADF|nr:uncharacterized protein LOC107043509 [Diachasma alloeum]